MVRGFDHGFNAPIAAQDMLIAFLQALPRDAYGGVCVQLQSYYDKCKSVRARLSATDITGLFVEERLTVRCKEVQGDLLLALLDVVMKAKKCSHCAAASICRRLLKDCRSDNTSSLFHTLGLRQGRDEETIFFSASKMSEVLSLVNQKKIRISSVADDLYIMQTSFDANTVKIGRAIDVEKRRKRLETSQNFRVHVVKAFPSKGFLERKIHRKLRNFRSNQGPGREWFHLDAKVCVRWICTFILRMRLWRGCKDGKK